jgi:hypothetical protein
MTVPSYSIPHSTLYVFPNELEQVVEGSGEPQSAEVLAGHGGAGPDLL